MQELLLHINWTAKPNIIGEPIQIRWYGVLFATGFMLGYQIVKRMFKKEGVSEALLDKFLIWTLVATIIGARLGHVFFYEWSYYSQHLSEIPKFWQGGLASHGGVIAVVIATLLFSKYISKRPSLWLFDKLVVGAILTSAFIRLGNLFNHEIVGQPTDVPWAFVFSELKDGQPRHPTQLYEALSYLLIFGILLTLYWKTNARAYRGRLLGTFLVLMFSARFLLEFTKVNQTDLVEGWPVNMGQILSIPAILVGVFFLIRSLRMAPAEDLPDVFEKVEEPEKEV